MFQEARRMNRRVHELPTIINPSSKDRAVRRVKHERTKLIAMRILWFSLFLYLIVWLRIGWYRLSFASTHEPSSVTKKNSVFSIGESGASNTHKEPTWVEHIPARSNTGVFVTMGSYVMDGDASSTTHPNSGTKDLILLVIGVGDFTAKAQPSTDKKLKRPPPVPKGLTCLLKDTARSQTYRFAEVNFHSNGTAYQGKISQTWGAIYFGERAVWISCPVPPSLMELKQRLVEETSSFTLQLIIEESPDRIFFDSNPTIPSLVLSTAYEQPLRNLTLCSSAIYGLTGSKWMIEWLEYHRAAGFDSMDLYIHNVGDLVMEVLNEYVRQNSDKFFVRLHDWKRMVDNGPIGFNEESGVGRGVQSEAWEHGQRLTRNDCFLRNRGRSRWVMFCDVDELFTSTAPGNANIYEVAITQICEKSFQQDPTQIGCSFSSVTTPPNAESTDESKLILERIDHSEARCQSPYNCGRFHHGREKYAVRTQRGSINPNGPFFYHAISQNYDISEKHHVLVPDSVAVVRHYAGHFSHSRKGGLPPDKSKYNPLPSVIIQKMRHAIYEQDGPYKELYARPGQSERFLKLDRITDLWRFARHGEIPPEVEQARAMQVQPSEPKLKNLMDKQPSEEKFMTFEYFGGRLNNQLWTLDWVFRTAQALNRTAILGIPMAREHYIGFPSSSKDASLWDIEYLLQAPFKFKFAWEITNPEEISLLFSDKSILSKECVWEFSESTKHVVRWAIKSGCQHRRIHFSTGGGLVHSYKADTRAYGVDPLVYWRHMRLHPQVVRLVRDWWTKQSGVEGSIENAVGLHFRSWREAGGDAAHGTKVCKRLSEKLLTNAAKRFHALESTCPKSCAAKFDDVTDVRQFWNVNEFDETCLPASEERIHRICDGSLHTLAPDQDFFVATDHEAPEVDEVLKTLGARMMGTVDSSALISEFVERNEHGLSARKYAKSILPILLDLSALLQVGRFYGSPASTLSQAVCLWRRAFNKREENPGMCQLVWWSTYSDVCEEICF